MKKRYIVLLALALLLFLCACGTEVPPTDEPVPPLALRNENTGATISLGMTRDEAEALLGEGTYFDEQKAAEERMKERLKAEGREGEEGWVVVAGSAEYETYVYGKGRNFLSLIYEEEVVVGISPAGGANPPGLTNWHDQYGLRYGADKSLVFTRYGEQETLLTSAADEEGNVYSVFEYYYDMDGNWVGFYDNPSYLVTVTTEDTKGQVVAVSMYTVTNPEDMSPPTENSTIEGSGAS